MNHLPLQCRIMRQTLSNLTFLPHQIKTAVPNWFRRRSFAVLNTSVWFGTWVERRLNRAVVASWPSGNRTFSRVFGDRDKPHSFFLQNTSCIRKPQGISGGGGAHPLHPSPGSAPVIKVVHLSWISKIFNRFLSLPSRKLKKKDPESKTVTTYPVCSKVFSSRDRLMRQPSLFWSTSYICKVKVLLQLYVFFFWSREMQLLHAYTHVLLASLLRGNQPVTDFQPSPIFRPLQTRIRSRVSSVSAGLHSERLGVRLILITLRQFDELNIS